jgi:hypothetical protein
MKNLPKLLKLLEDCYKLLRLADHYTRWLKDLIKPV